MTCWKLKCWRKRRRSKRLTLNFHIPWKMYSNTCSIFIQNHKFYLFICRCKMFIHTHIKHVINIWHKICEQEWAGWRWILMSGLCDYELFGTNRTEYFLTSWVTLLPKKHSIQATTSELFLFLLDIRSCYNTYQTFPGTISHEVSLEKLRL